jgi:cytidylate kinase
VEAHPKERIERRAQERETHLAQVAEALETRDALDARTNPLEPAPDAVLIDTTDLDADAVLTRALELVRERGLAP